MSHVPQPPSDTLTGRWRIEQAVAGEPIQVGRVAGVVWELTLRHLATDVVEHLRCRARRTTTYYAGQEVDGHLTRDREGEWFKRDWPARDAA